MTITYFITELKRMIMKLTFEPFYKHPQVQIIGNLNDKEHSSLDPQGNIQTNTV